MIGPDEMVEVTPQSLRIRKAELDQTLRNRASKRARMVAAEA
jgi:predicted membrane GTPase involved in stress response